MSKTERRKLFQPIPLSSILDPTYQSPFSKLEKFQVDMEISSKFQSKAQPSVWQKLQSSLISAMSNLVVISHPVYASSTNSFTAMSHRTASSMSLFPWRPYKSSELLTTEEIEETSPTTTNLAAKSVPEKSASLYHSVRSGLQCLRYLATHPLCSEDEKRKLTTQTPTRHYYDCRKQNNIVLPAIEFPIAGGGTLFFPISSAVEPSSRYSLSAPTSPTHHYYYQVSKPVVSNLFSWAMSGFLFAQQHRQYNSLYKNYCLFSPVHAKGAEVNATVLSSQKSAGNQDINSGSPRTTAAEGNIEIYITSCSQQDSKCNNEVDMHCSSSTSPTKTVPPNSPVKANSGCILIETNWGRMNEESGSSRANFHTMSVCSSSSTLKGGTLTFSCSSTVSSSPRAMMSSHARTAARRFPTESESSTDSFVEFSASVESTDSFCIVFESAPGACLDDLNRDDDEEWDDDDDDEDDDSDEDDEDQIFNYSGTSDDIFVDGYIFQADGIDVGVPTSCDQVDLCANSLIPPKKKSKTVSSYFVFSNN